MSYTDMAAAHYCRAGQKRDKQAGVLIAGAGELLKQAVDL
jgi:hypothetical protein